MEASIFATECEEYGKKIDFLTDKGDYAGLELYLAKLEDFARTHEFPEYAPIFYYLGTGNEVLANYYRKSGLPATNSVVVGFQKQSLSYMRKALSFSEHFGDNLTLLQCIYTNYANSLYSCGRVIEALRIYRKSIELSPDFGMSVGNYGRALNFYANIVNDPSHYQSLHYYAYQALTQALKLRDPNMHENAIKFFEKMTREYEMSPGRSLLTTPIVFKKHNLGDVEERAYRQWCLKKHLFLHPLNDIIELETAFAHDPLTITSYTEHVNQQENDAGKNGGPPKWFSMLNQLKEEYGYARFLCYEGSEKIRELHYADKEIKLSLSDFDYVNCSIRLEQLKSSFKNLFSIFDQIAFLSMIFGTLALKREKLMQCVYFRLSISQQIMLL